MNYLIDGDDGSDCRSPYHKGCSKCEHEEEPVCPICLNLDGWCENECSEYMKGYNDARKEMIKKIEPLVKLLHAEDWEFGNSEDECKRLIEATRNKIGYSKKDLEL
jgi:hypothetical protein